MRPPIGFTCKVSHVLILDVSTYTESVISVNKVVPKAQVLATALEWAKQINLNSPDSIQSTKRALLLNKQKSDVEEVVIAHMRSKENKRAYDGEKMKVRGR